MKPSISFQNVRTLARGFAQCNHGLFLLVIVAVFLVAQPLQAGEKASQSYPVPSKGPLVSELKENLNSDKAGPEVVIRKYEDAQGNQVREFVLQGATFEIQVIPANGPPYYLIDNDGDGLFETRINGYEPRIVVPQWVLFRF
ncbi:MAG: DUF2782 domain-containing protein [Magnetococcales bacterium]|nr:DUF2782 domain-containing protein [Magnetococcales bacterium]MBF0439086.1 DUF2782 domain-containing protein [Magnetococcales bacterium]